MLQFITFSHYEKNVKLEKKPKVDGYFVFTKKDNENMVEYYFENRIGTDACIVFYFIKIKNKNRTSANESSSCEGRA